MNRIIPSLDEVIEQIKRINQDNYVETTRLIIKPETAKRISKVQVAVFVNSDIINDFDIKQFYDTLGNGLYERIISQFKMGKFDSIELDDEFKRQAFAMGLTSILETSPYFHYAIAIGLGSELKFQNLGADPYKIYNQEIGRLSKKILHLGSDPARIEYLDFNGVTKTKWTNKKKLLWRRIYQIENGTIINSIMLSQDSIDKNLFYFDTIDNDILDPELIKSSINYLLEIIPLVIGQEEYVSTFNDTIKKILESDKRFKKLEEVGKYQIVAN